MLKIITMQIDGENYSFGFDRYSAGRCGFMWWVGTAQYPSRGSKVFVYDDEAKCIRDMAHCMKNHVLRAFGQEEEL